jgi:hypothetical protein
VDCRGQLFQAVRIVDVFILGPVMIQIGRKTRGNVGTFLMIAGIATIVFNGLTFLDIENE